MVDAMLVGSLDIYLSIVAAGETEMSVRINSQAVCVPWIHVMRWGRILRREANVLADALSQKSLTIAWMRIKEEEPVDKFVDLKLDIGKVSGRACLNQLQISSTFKSEIQRAQQDEQKLWQLFQPVGDMRREEFTKDGERLWIYKGRICIPDVGSLRQDLLSKSHNSEFSIHPESTKMYYDLKKMFWWPEMKGDVATVVSKCLTCQKVKIEH
ncbi:uncharacterized protein [Arachis hypogaea]|uniref:uncharacterized protein n=1 Tax=Arachis hypogaea TaxID=3818 RepID=UPI003B20F3C8